MCALEIETQCVEWKETWRDEYLKWICGFANAYGGVLTIGKNDHGSPVGVEQAAKLMVDIPNKVRDTLGIMVDVNLRKEHGKDLVEIRVEPYPSPISYRGEYHYRSGSTKQTLQGAALERFLLKKRGRHWEDAPEPSFTIRSCSASALDLFRKRASESGRMDRSVLADRREIILTNLELVERFGLKRAACLLFSKYPERYVSGSWIKIGYFVTDDDLRYQDEVHGNLFEQVEKTIELLLSKYLKAFITYDNLQRKETFLFPVPALGSVNKLPIHFVSVFWPAPALLVSHIVPAMLLPRALARLKTLVTKCKVNLLTEPYVRRYSMPWSIKTTGVASLFRLVFTMTGSFFGTPAFSRKTGRWKSFWGNTHHARLIRCSLTLSFGRDTSNRGDAVLKRFTESAGIMGSNHRSMISVWRE